MGFAFVVAPLMLNVLIILVVAVAFNGLFPWRRYPAALVRPAETLPAPWRLRHGYEAISHEDFVYALTQLDSYHRRIGGRPAAHLCPGHRPPPRPAGAGRGGEGRQPFCDRLKAAKSPPLR
jgi:hypothetical protein